MDETVIEVALLADCYSALADAIDDCSSSGDILRKIGALEDLKKANASIGNVGATEMPDSLLRLMCDDTCIGASEVGGMIDNAASQWIARRADLLQLCLAADHLSAPKQLHASTLFLCEAELNQELAFMKELCCVDGPALRTHFQNRSSPAAPVKHRVKPPPTEVSPPFEISRMRSSATHYAVRYADINTLMAMIDMSTQILRWSHQLSGDDDSGSGATSAGGILCGDGRYAPIAVRET